MSRFNKHEEKKLISISVFLDEIHNQTQITVTLTNHS